jgi:hypothetical protein
MGLPAPWLIALVLGCVALAAIPTRRLADAGIRPAWLATYLAVVAAMGVAVVAFRGPGRFLVPFLVVLYIAPLVAAPETTARVMRRGRRPPKPVGSGPGRDVGADPGHDVGADPGHDVGADPATRGRDDVPEPTGPGPGTGPDDPRP